MINENYSFDGHDWTELALAFGIVEDKESLNSIEEGIIEEEISNILWNAVSWERRKEKTIEINLLRKFLDKISSNCIFYSKPVWQALNKIEDDQTLVKYFCVLMPYCWI